MTDAELIQEVAEKVMGWELLYLTETDYPSGPHWKTEESYWSIHEWNPLTNLNHAFMVVKNMREKGWESCIRNTPEIPPDDWEASFTKRGIRMNGSFHKNLGHAICLAALKTEVV